MIHNLNGEYGHRQHKELAQLLYSLIAKNLYVFHKSEKLINPKLLKKKIRILKYYKSQRKILGKLRYFIKHEGLKRVK